MFRVDNLHHLVSVVAQLGPSPDWFVGVAALELCLKNCSWIAEKQMNLYLWDAGSDSGTSYESPPQPSIPHERIRRITATEPPTGPFYDPDTNEMKPFARLTIKRKQTFPSQCTEVASSAQQGRGSLDSKEPSKLRENVSQSESAFKSATFQV